MGRTTQSPELYISTESPHWKCNLILYTSQACLPRLPGPVPIQYSTPHTLPSAVTSETWKENSVKVVSHKYGGEAGNVFGEACTAAGNAAMTYMNVQSLGVKGLVKKTAKQTGKNVVKNVLTDSSGKSVTTKQ